MSMTPEIREKALESPDIGKRGKGKITLMREEMRLKFMNRMEQKFDVLLDAIENRAVSAQNVEMLKEVLKQTIGEAHKEVELEGELDEIVEIRHTYQNAPLDTTLKSGSDTTESQQV